MYLEVVALLGVARRFLFRYSPTIPPPCHTHSPVFLYLGNPYSCISVFVNALNSCFPLCEAKFDRLLVHSGICPPTQNSISLQFLVHSPSRPAAPVSALGVLIQKFTIISIPGRADRKTAFVNSNHPENCRNTHILLFGPTNKAQGLWWSEIVSFIDIQRRSSNKRTAGTSGKMHQFCTEIYGTKYFWDIPREKVDQYFISHIRSSSYM